MSKGELADLAAVAIDGSDVLLCLVVSHPGNLSQEGRASVRAMVEQQIGNRVPVIVLSEAMTATPVYLSNAELLKHQERCEQ